ncbi:hypothetical protein HDK90DRAFT_53149 [Phyllosticta capitalensis]|uniref:Uncharacterized protein n=1 Tax=Phyllosticta capitalensis TaxID=121624 RepID=A0ABR1YFC8_9PEZI
MSDVCLCLLSVANCRQSVCRSLLSAGRRVPGQAGLGAGPRFVLHWRRMARDTRQRRTDDASLRTKNCTAVEVESRRWVMMSKAGCRWVAPKKWTWRRRAGFKRCRCKSKVLSRSREEVKVGECLCRGRQAQFDQFGQVLVLPKLLTPLSHLMLTPVAGVDGGQAPRGHRRQPSSSLPRAPTMTSHPPRSNGRMRTQAQPMLPLV